MSPFTADWNTLTRSRAPSMNGIFTAFHHVLIRGRSAPWLGSWPQTKIHNGHRNPNLKVDCDQPRNEWRAELGVHHQEKP